jgi:UDP-2,3-diacylglucosamine pyrophosphatase LpxH
MEDFFFDGPFSRLLDSLRKVYPDPKSLLLVLNGDIFDFLTVTPILDVPTCEEIELSVSNSEQRYGLNPTPEKSIYKFQIIQNGHPVFFSALARFVGAGYRVEILRGNHDLELFFPEIQEHLKNHLSQFEGGPTREQANERVGFQQWFYMEPGRLFIEHGNQYEASNSIRYPLRPLLPPRKKGDSEELLLDYPLGSLFVRYFYNRVHRIDPYTPKVISFEQYLEFIRRYNFLDLFRVARDHYPFFISALTPETTSGSAKPSSEDNAKQEAEFQSLQESTEPQDLYRQLNELKIVPMAATKLALFNEMLKPIFRRLIWVGATVIVSLYLWLSLFTLIQAPNLFENVFAKASLLFLFSVATLLALFWGGNQLGRKLRRRKDLTVERCAERADRIARLTGVKMVLMGHTHVVDIQPVSDGKAMYANSGTWTTVENPWKNIDPDARKMTFLYVRGDNVQVSRWNDNAERIEEVPLFNVADDPVHQRCTMPAVPPKTRK